MPAGIPKRLYDSIFADTGYEEFRLVESIPAPVRALLLKNLRQSQNQTDLGHFIANPDQPVDYGCTGGGRKIKLFFGGKSMNTVFLFVKSGGFSPGYRVWICELATDGASLLYFGSGPEGAFELVRTLVFDGLPDFKEKIVDGTIR